MINLAVNSNIMKPPVSVSGKAAPVAAETQKKTFQNVLLETIQNKSASDDTVAVNSANPTFLAAGDEYEISDYYEEADEGTPDEVTSYAEPEEPQAETPGEITQYVEIEIRGRRVKQATDEYLAYLGYNVAALKANDLGLDLAGHVDSNGFVPKYIVPLDMGWETDYTMTVATPENLATKAANNAAFDSMPLKSTSEISNISRTNAALGSAASQTAAAVDNNPITTQPAEQKPPQTPKIENPAETTVADNSAFGSVALKTPIAVNNIIQNNEKPSVNEAVKEEYVIPDTAQNRDLSDAMESIAKTVANNVALRISSDLNILDIWDPEEDNDEKK